MKISRLSRGFTLIELLVVISIIALLAALVIGSGNIGSSKRQVTQSTRKAIEGALERYQAQFAEYPEPVDAEETAEIMPGKVYRIGAARCLYQALTGDGSDAIKGIGNHSSDGRVSSEELRNVIMQDWPEGMRRKVGTSYLLVDAFGHPFQYIKADGEKNNTINSSYDLWSYAQDEKNIMAKSKDTEANASLGAMWIKNW
ncbi:type II secretion system protein [Prosthecobacter sp.]|uniref:type II secretion system protein n=1 Tax=Prosthecobacter sp. TaxID=1965333 RepID=UPI003782E60F